MSKDYLKKGSTASFIRNIYFILRSDEELLRLLNYKPEGYDEVDRQVYLDPLNELLPNLVDEDKDEYWELISKSFVLGEKVSDLELDAICRVYIYEGRRRPEFGNYAVASQELNIDIFVHENFDKDSRIARINDRINELIALERVAGYGMLEYQAGDPREAPTHYRRYLNRYVFSMGKK